MQGVSCQVCGKQRVPGQIHPRESRLLKGTTILICNSCEASKKEPRSYIILVGRLRGLESVLDYIKNERYVGRPIEAKEILK